LGVGDIQANRVNALVIVGEQVVELGGPAGGGGDEVADVEGRPG
jgi:hypothetical protein